ncbi:hypothetical protein F5B17DRAFT_245143 [Nemania serpens]|nr:hypothetical protein F5B17DRAFT_245143 [Nemania serpens]
MFKALPSFSTAETTLPWHPAHERAFLRPALYPASYEIYLLYCEAPYLIIYQWTEPGRRYLPRSIVYVCRFRQYHPHTNDSNYYLAVFLWPSPWNTGSSSQARELLRGVKKLEDSAATASAAVVVVFVVVIVVAIVIIVIPCSGGLGCGSSRLTSATYIIRWCLYQNLQHGFPGSLGEVGYISRQTFASIITALLPTSFLLLRFKSTLKLKKEFIRNSPRTRGT